MKKSSYLPDDDQKKNGYTAAMANYFKHEHHTVAVAPQTILLTLGLLVGGYLLFLIRDILILIFLAFILMVALSPLTKQMQKVLKLPRLLSVVTSYFLFVGLVILFFAILIPPLVKELTGLMKFINIPVIQEELSHFDFSITNISNFADRIGSSVGAVLGIISTTFSSIFTIFTLLVMSFFLLQERDKLHRRIRWFTKDDKNIEKAKNFLDDLEAQLGGWVRGELILMLVIGSLTYVGLLVLGIPYALPLAILAGLLEILPNIGPTIAAIPAIAIAFITGGPIVALSVLVLNIVVQQLENNVIVPKVMSDNANVSPLVAIISILIGVKLGGFIGALLAVPIYIFARTVYLTFFYQAAKK